MSSGAMVQLHPLDVSTGLASSASSPALPPFSYTRPGFPSASTSTSTVRPVGQHSSTGNGNGSETSSAGGISKHRQRVHSARKKMERVAHERAPGLSSMVAGHHGGLTYTSLTSSGAPVTGKAILKQNRAGKGKRYSVPEYQHLVPDESGELHDPEYESIRIVTRKPSVSTIASNSDDEGTYSSSASEDDAYSRDDLSSHAGSSSARNLPSYRYIPSYERYRNTSLNATLLQPPKTLQGFTTNLSPHSSGPRHSSRSSNVNTSRNSFDTSRSSVYSADDRSSKKSASRTYAEANVTYLAPSVTMPPSVLSTSPAAGSSLTSGNYNPYTYIPTTSTHANSHSGRHSSAHPSNAHRPYTSPLGGTSSSSSAAAAATPRTHTLPASTTATIYTQPIETAPPIAWNSSFTPSSEHPERHRMRHHTSAEDTMQAGKAGMQRSFQKLKLDVSFGLLKLKR